MARPASQGLLAGMRIRKKLILLHTSFSVVLALILLVALRPTIAEVVERAEIDESKLLLDSLAASIQTPHPEPPLTRDPDSQVIRRSGSAADLNIDTATIAAATGAPGRAVAAHTSAIGPGAVLFAPAHDQTPATFHATAVRIPDARAAVTRLYVLMVLALLGVYGLVAVALEVFVLPENVYRPIRRMLAADHAVQEGRKEAEIIPELAIPADELGEIMRSRNESVLKLRRQEAALADALSRLEQVANDLKRKNHLLETARRNLAESDRLASLGMMSAGIAHELNTPLTVLKGLVEKLNTHPKDLDKAQAALMLRVVQRLERLGDSLLDFARARHASVKEVQLAPLVQEAMLLVGLDREAGSVQVQSGVPSELTLACDPDRMMQVLVNLIRNAVDAVRPTGNGQAVTVGAERSEKDGRPWVSLTVTDTGPGIDPAILPHLFEPFVSTRLDSRGTGLGLAVADGIVREHGGVILARNRTDRSGAVFEVLLPAATPSILPADPSAPAPIP